MPSRRHDLLAYAIPRVRKSRELDDEPTERRPGRAVARRRSTAPCRPGSCRGFGRRFSVVTEEVAGFPVHVVTPRHRDPDRTLFYVHGGGFMAPVDPFHVRYVARLAPTLRRPGRGARLPARAGAHLARLVRAAGRPRRALGRGAGVTLAGDSAGGGYALGAGASALRDRGGPQPSRAAAALAVGRPHDVARPTPRSYGAVDPWLFLGKVHAYAGWWAGSPDDLGRPEVSPGAGRPRRACRAH